MAIEFWGVDVKAGQPLKVWPGYDRVIHLSQASVGELKRDTNDAIPLTLKFGEQKLVLGTLLSKTIPQIAFDLVFQTEFELSHNWKNGSVYFSGYDGEIAEGKPFGKPFFDSSDSSSDSSDSSSDSEKKRHVLPLETAADVKPKMKEEKVKHIVTAKDAAKKPQVKAKEPNDEDKSDDDSDDDSDDSDLPDDVSGLPVDSDLEMLRREALTKPPHTQQSRLPRLPTTSQKLLLQSLLDPFLAILVAKHSPPTVLFSPMLKQSTQANRLDDFL